MRHQYEGYTPPRPRSDAEVLAAVEGAYWKRSRYADGVVLAGQDEAEDGVLGVEDAAGGTVYEYSDGNAHETGVFVRLGNPGPDSELPYHLIGVAVAITESATAEG